MKLGNAILIAGGLYGLYWITEIGALANTVNILFQGVQFNGLTNLSVVLTVQNITNASVTVNSMTGNLLVNGNQLANLSFFNNPVTVPANGSVNIPIQVSLSLLSLPGTVQQLLSMSGTTLTFNAVGNANVSNLILPFNLSLPVSI